MVCMCDVHAFLQAVLPIVFGALEENAANHWNPAVHGLTCNVRKMFMVSATSPAAHRWDAAVRLGQHCRFTLLQPAQACCTPEHCMTACQYQVVALCGIQS